jgi:hypothetical protein
LLRQSLRFVVCSSYHQAVAKDKRLLAGIKTGYALPIQSQIKSKILLPPRQTKKLRVKTGKTMVGGAAARALVILPEAPTQARQLAAKGPGPRFYLFAAHKALRAKKHIG